MQKSGIDIIAIKRQLRHKQLSTTLRYVPPVDAAKLLNDACADPLQLNDKKNPKKAEKKCFIRVHYMNNYCTQGQTTPVLKFITVKELDTESTWLVEMVSINCSA